MWIMHNQLSENGYPLYYMSARVHQHEYATHTVVVQVKQLFVDLTSLAEYR